MKRFLVVLTLFLAISVYVTWKFNFYASDRTVIFRCEKGGEIVGIQPDSELLKKTGVKSYLGLIIRPEDEVFTTLVKNVGDDVMEIRVNCK